MAHQWCRNCMNYQKSLNPYGCFKQRGTTGFFGRLEKLVFGCAHFRNTHYYITTRSCRV